MRVAVVVVAFTAACFGSAVGIVFAKPPLEYYYAQWVHYWESDKPWQCTGC